MEEKQAVVPFGAKKSNIGAWEMSVSNQPVVLNASQVWELERVLNKQYVPAAHGLFGQMYEQQNFMMSRYGVPALVVRFDMAPMGADGVVRAYEVEANTAGFGVLDAIGVPIHKYVATSLNAMGLQELGVGVAPARAVQLDDLMVLAGGLESLGVHVRQVDVTNGVPRNIPLWLRAGHEDLGVMGHLMPQCLNFHYHGGGHKGYLPAIDETAQQVSEVGLSEVEELLDKYDNGLILKPINEWGTHSVDCYAKVQPWKKRSVNRGRMSAKLNSIISEGRGGDYIVQKFWPPEAIEGGFRIWRVVAVWCPGTGYRVIGGLWNWRPDSLRVHGATNAVFGPIVLPS